MISYKPLWRTILERDMTKTDLRLNAGFGTATLAKMSKNEYVSMDIIDRICEYLDCNIEDVIEYIPCK